MIEYKRKDLTATKNGVAGYALLEPGFGWKKNSKSSALFSKREADYASVLSAPEKRSI